MMLSNNCSSLAESQGLGAIELFYRDVKERRREMFGTAEPAFDTR